MERLNRAQIAMGYLNGTIIDSSDDEVGCCQNEMEWNCRAVVSCTKKHAHQLRHLIVCK